MSLWKKLPERQCKVKANMSVMTEATASFGSHLTRAEEKKLVKDLHTRELAETGAQTNLAGISLLHKLNFPPEKRMQTSHAIRGTADSNLDVMGAVLLRMELDGKEERFIMFICRNEKSTIFSRTTLRQLRLIAEDFAKLSSSSSDSQVSGCNCPTRTLLPPLPMEMPFPWAGGQQGEAGDVDEEAVRGICVQHFPVPTATGDDRQTT